MIKRTFSLCLLAVVCAGCNATGTNLYGPKSCAPDEHLLAAYPTANGAAAVCLPKEHVAFMLCTRELALLNASSSSSSSGSLKIDVPAVGSVGADGKVGANQSMVFSENAELAKARAEMMRACLNMLPANERAAATVGTAPAPK